MYFNPEIMGLPMCDSDLCRTILDVNAVIHRSTPRWEWHLEHILLTERYARIINERLGSPVDPELISATALGHDLLKDKYLDQSDATYYNESTIPKDLNRYVRGNLDVLEQFMLDDYFNTDITLHALSAGIWLHRELNIYDHCILYPIFFHSCPIIPVYRELPELVQTAVDIIMLSDKISSNHLRINTRENITKADLDLTVFGPSGHEFNYTIGLVLARLIGQGKSTEKNGVESLQFYIDRARSICPLMAKQYSINKLGGGRVWPKRESQALKMQLQTLGV